MNSEEIQQNSVEIKAKSGQKSDKSQLKFCQNSRIFHSKLTQISTLIQANFCLNTAKNLPKTCQKIQKSKTQSAQCSFQVPFKKYMLSKNDGKK